MRLIPPTPERFSGRPILPAQTALTRSLLSDDATGEVVSECLVLPNVVFYFDWIEGVRVGEAILTSVPFSQEFAGKLGPYAENVTACECERHNGLTMEVETDALYE